MLNFSNFDLIKDHKNIMRKAQFFILSAFAIVVTSFFISQWIEPHTIPDISSVLKEEIFVFNNIVEKTEKVIEESKSVKEAKFNLEEYIQYVEMYCLKKGFKITFDTSNLVFDQDSNRVEGYINITLQSPNILLKKKLEILKQFS